MKLVAMPVELSSTSALHRPKPRLRMFIGTSSASPLPFGSPVLNASSTSFNSSQVVGTSRPRLSSQVLLMNMCVAETR